MEHRSIYEQIAGRTDGTVYIGVVGPVRTGKSTFIKRFMEQLVLPNIENVYERERATDELPQSGSGRTIMTAEPKFVPNEAARISPDGKTTLRVRLIDSVGYMIPGAVGDTEDGKPRMVTTPWAPEELPMAQAAELGTKKVMEDHSSLGVVVTTDGTVTDIPREDYREAEARAITDMQKTGKPFVVLVNTQSPGAAPAEALCAQLRSEYGVQALAMDCMHMQTQDIGRLLEAVMYAFPVEELRFFLPSWVRALPDGHPVKAALYDAMLERAGALTSSARPRASSGRCRSSSRSTNSACARSTSAPARSAASCICRRRCFTRSCPGRPGWRSPTMKPFCRCCRSWRRRKSSTTRSRPRSSRSRPRATASSCPAQRS